MKEKLKVTVSLVLTQVEFDDCKTIRAKEAKLYKALKDVLTGQSKWPSDGVGLTIGRVSNVKIAGKRERTPK